MHLFLSVQTIQKPSSPTPTPRPWKSHRKIRYFISNASLLVLFLIYSIHFVSFSLLSTTSSTTAASAAATVSLSFTLSLFSMAHTTQLQQYHNNFDYYDPAGMELEMERHRKRRKKWKEEVVDVPLRRDPLEVFGTDIMLKILSYLDARSVALSLLVSRAWHAVSSTDRLWASKVARCSFFPFIFRLLFLSTGLPCHFRFTMIFSLLGLNSFVLGFVWFLMALCPIGCFRHTIKFLLLGLVSF